MSDLLVKLHRHPVSSRLLKACGVPKPVALARADGGYVARPLAGQRLLCAQAPGGYALAALQAAALAAGATLADDGAPAIAIVDATGCRSAHDARVLYDAFHPVMRSLAVNGRVLLAAADPDACADPVAAALARGVEGFMRALAKELGPRGICVNLLYVGADALARLDGPVRFFCAPQATYVSGQAVRVDARVAGAPSPATAQVLAGKVALVTGAARGIGLAIAERLAQEGARVVALDVPSAGAALQAAAARLGASALALDITAAGAPQQIAAWLQERCGGVDIVVHNAGITRDRTLARMGEQEWDLVMAVNFAAVTAIDAALLAHGTLRDAGRIVCMSSIGGVAGNFGQTNYALSKAALIGYVRAQAPLLAARGICINAVAPGFIETAMTDAMPFVTRELGRRLNSLKQGGQARDVAELAAFLATPGAAGISGATIRVCGQALLGA